jgi:hypothetical protein
MGTKTSMPDISLNTGLLLFQVWCTLKAVLDRQRQELQNPLCFYKSLWRGYINTNILFIFQDNVSESGFCLRNAVLKWKQDDGYVQKQLVLKIRLQSSVSITRITPRAEKLPLLGGVPNAFVCSPQSAEFGMEIWLECRTGRAHRECKYCEGDESQDSDMTWLIRKRVTSCGCTMKNAVTPR